MFIFFNLIFKIMLCSFDHNLRRMPAILLKAALLHVIALTFLGTFNLGSLHYFQTWCGFFF